jgi:hypothetical protein
VVVLRLVLLLVVFLPDVQAQPLELGAATVALDTRSQLSEAQLLDVGIRLFDPGIPEDLSTHSKLGIFPEIRRAEARYLPVNLSAALQDSNAWGVVRVIPEEAELSELLVEGRIVEATGLRLQLVVAARDATGRLWFENTYQASTDENSYPVPAGGDPFASLYHRVANDLLAMRDKLDRRALVEIRRVALLRYAVGLAPDAFNGYLGVDEQGRYSVLRLPAEGDSMAARVERIRNQEYLFIDNVDEQYRELHREMAPTYDLWRQYDREQTLYRAEYQQRAADRERHGRRGSYAAMEQAYNAYRLTRIQEQDLEELALGFDNETAPTIVETSGRVFRLTGTLDSQYQDWRKILQDIFALEIGL